MHLLYILTIIASLLGVVKAVPHDTPLIESANSPVSVLPITETVLTKGNRLCNIYNV